MRAQIVVLAKAPAPGRVKTRLCPPYTPDQAAALAAAALRDTLAAVAGTPAERRVLALAGPATSVRRWLPPEVEVLPQRGDGLAQRIAHAQADAFRQVPMPVLLIGMDTPQVTPRLLALALRRLLADGVDAVLGPSADGGYWAIGQRRPRPGHVLGVPMSVACTGARQLARLRDDGLAVGLLPTLRDVDGAADAAVVAAAAPHTVFAATQRALVPGEVEGVA